MHTLKVTLKQHTPLIHFQHDQDGATLRASEVKPRLDKYILNKLTPEERTQGEKDGWIKKGNEKVWLDYKMNIRACGKKKEFLIASLLSSSCIIDENNGTINESSLPFTILRTTPFFAQESVNSSNKQEDSPVFYKKKNKEDKYDFLYDEDNWESIGKKGLMWDSLEMKLSSIHDALINRIDSCLTDFFICTNFGTRSSKGFGSFTRICDNETVLKALKSNYKFVYKKSKTINNLGIVFKTIKEDYQLIKSGVNHNGYTKSILFCYAVKKMENNPRWEKRFFKKAVKDKMGYNKRLFDRNNPPIYDIDGNMRWEDPQKYEYRYLRALLGLAEQFEFLLEYKQDGAWRRDKRNKLVIKPKVSEVERYESPIIFKIINGVIYIVGNDVNKGLLGKQTQLMYSIGNREVPVSQKDKSLSTPVSFVLSDFMEFAMGKGFNLGYIKEK